MPLLTDILQHSWFALPWQDSSSVHGVRKVLDSRSDSDILVRQNFTKFKETFSYLLPALLVHLLLPFQNIFCYVMLSFATLWHLLLL